LGGTAPGLEPDAADAPAALHRRHDPRRKAGASDHAAHENGHTDGGADLPAGQQLGPPQARKTGSFLTEATIATPAPIASASKTKISAVIFTIPPDNDHEHELGARNRQFGAFLSLLGVAIADLPDVLLASAAT